MVGSSDVERSPVIKALRLITHLASSKNSVALSDLSRALDLPKPTVFRLVGALESAGYIEKDSLTRRYRVGAAFEDVAWNALRYGSGHSLRRLLMNELSERLAARVNLVVLRAGNLSFVEWVDSTAPLRIAIDITSHAPIPIHCSASGKLLLAFGSTELQDLVLGAAPLKAYTKKSIATVPELRRELSDIRSRGFAVDDQELIPGVNCLAVPVRNRTGEVVAGLAVMAPAATLPLERLRGHLDDVRRCAALISAELGWNDGMAAQVGVAGGPRPGKALAGREAQRKRPRKDTTPGGRRKPRTP